MSNLQTPIKVLIVEADGLLRDMLHTVLRAERRLQVVGATGDVSEAVRLATATAPDVALIGLDQDDGQDALSVAQAITSRVRIVFFAEHPDQRTLSALAAFRAAGWSYLLRPSVNDVATLVPAIEGAATGLVVLDPLVVESLGRRDARLSSLTKRQLEVLSLMAKGHNNAAIARALVLEEKSVENHINAIFGQLNLNRDRTAHPRVKAVLLFLHETTGATDGDLSEATLPHKAA